VKRAECNLISVLGHGGIKGNEITDQLVRIGSSNVHLWDLNQHLACQQELPRRLSGTG
jgi:hypothetical protein